MIGRTAPRPEQRQNDEVAESFLDFMQFERNASPNTVRAYANDLRQWQAFCREQSSPFYPVERVLIARYLMRLKGEGMASGTIMRKAATLSAFAKYLVYDGICDDTSGIGPLPKRAKSLPQIMTEGEIERLLDSCGLPADERPDADVKKNAVALRDRAMIEMAYSCGLRASELCSLKLRDIDESRGIIYVRGKGDKERIVPYVGAIKNTIRRYLEESRPLLVLDAAGGEQLFISRRGRALSRQELWKVVQRRGKCAGISKSRLHPHVLRHSFATHLQRRGMNLRTLQEMLGHSSIATTEKYSHLDTELRDIYDSFHPRA